MNKKLIAAAVAAGLAMPGLAMADATVYGKINTGIVSYDNDTPDDDGLAIFDEASRLGFKGSEDLGGGLKAIFKMEGTVDMDGSANFNFNRDRYVGLGGGWGNVIVGYFNTAYKNSTGKYDMFADRWGDITGSGTHGALDRREANQIGYNGKFGSVKFGATIDLSESPDNTANTVGDESANGYTVGLNVPFGAFEIAAAYAVRGGSAGTSEGDTGTKLGFKWAGPVKVNVVYEQFVDDSATTDDTTTVLTGQVGFGAGSNNFAVGYTMADPDGNDNDCTQMTAGWMHKLSKKTEVNVIYSAIDNDANSNCLGRFGASVGYAGASNGADPAGLAVGIQHNF
jgi:predicted porin